MELKRLPELDVLWSTEAGVIGETERRSIEVYGLGAELERRESVRARSGKGNGFVHLDVYPAPDQATAKGTLPMLAGLSGHVLMYAGFLDALSRRGWNVVGIDVRGHGRSSGRRGNFTMRSVIEDAAVGLAYGADRWPDQPLGFVGSSLGGFYALVVQNAIPQIQATAAHWVMLPDMPVTKKDARMRPIARVLEKIAPGMRMSTRGIANWDGVAESAELREQLQRDPMMVWRYSVRGLTSGILYAPERPLTELRSPLLVVIGEADTMTPMEYTQRVFARLQGDKTMTVIPGAGHMGGLVEHRDEVVDAMDAFLTARLAGAPSARDQSTADAPSRA